MFKKKVLLALGMAAVLSTGCAATSVWAEENADVQARRKVQIQKKILKQKAKQRKQIQKQRKATPPNWMAAQKWFPGVKMETTIFTDSFTIQLILTKTRLIRWSL